MKYSINGTGNIVAERDIYSLGGFIPKGTVGGKIASEAQLSQDGECWLAGGDISDRPDIRIKDNAYIGTFTPGVNPVHTDGVTEFSGNTLIPGGITIKSSATDTKNNMFVKDSFIGVSMDVLCGPSTTATAFPFEQGRYVSTAPRGTAFSSVAMQTGDINICRSTDSVIRGGLNTYVYLPTGYSGRILWSYKQGGTAVYSGESKVIPSGLTKIEHPVYKRFMLHITKVNGTAMTPTDLLATGAKILGHISDSLLMEIRPESASGQYVMDKSSLLMNTDNFGLATTQLRSLAGSMYDTTMYTKTDRWDYKLYGTFRNVERLEYTKLISDSYRTAATRDTYISAYDCPLLRVDDDTYDTSLMGTGDLVLRRCIVPKGRFAADPINGNTYEDLDFSYANEDLGFAMTGYSAFNSSHREGLYRVKSGTNTLGFVSHKGNLDATARLLQADVYLPLDGDLVESGSYSDLPGTDYEDAKIAASNRVRMARPLAALGAVFPSMPTGYAVDAIIYLDSSFIINSVVSNPTSISTDDPYFILVFRKGDGNTPLPVNEFIALNRTLKILDYTKVPEITGSAYVGAGCTVRGDVQLHGDPYVNRVFDVNMWEVGTTSGALAGLDYEASKAPTFAGNRYRFVEAFPVESGGTISCAAGYYMCAYWYGEDGLYLSQSNWDQTFTVSGPQKFVGIVLKKAANAADAGELIEDSDIPLANVKYLRAFKKRRYITNEIDRTSPEDILLGLDLWMKNFVSTSAANKGRYFKELIGVSNKYLNPKSPINAGSAWSITTGVPGTYAYLSSSWDAVTKFLGGGTAANAALMAVEIRAQSGNDLALSDAFSARIVIEFTPTPRIIVPYGSDTLFIGGPKIRMYDNAVLSRNLNQEEEIVLQGDAVMGYDFNSGSCMCFNGHSDAIIKLP